MLTMENKSQNTMANNMPSNEGGPSNTLPDQGKHMYFKMRNVYLIICFEVTKDAYLNIGAFAKY